MRWESTGGMVGDYLVCGVCRGSAETMGILNESEGGSSAASNKEVDASADITGGHHVDRRGERRGRL